MENKATKLGSAANVGLQMTKNILRQEFFYFSLSSVKTLVGFLFGVNDQMLRNWFPVTKDVPQRLNSRSLSLEGVLGG